MSKRHLELIFLLGTLTAFVPLSVDLYLPALPLIAAGFSAEPGEAQLSLASFFLGLAIGQAFYGPLADRFGRKRPLIVGLVVFVVTSAGCALATSIEMLIVLRFFQAFGACAGPVISRAIVRDLFDGREAVRIFSLLLLVMGVAPVLAPLLGGQIIAWFAWPMVFWILAAAGVGGLACCVLRLPETHRLENTRSLALRNVVGSYFYLLRDRAFLGYALTGAMSLGGMFAYIVGSPFIFIDLFHVASNHFGFFFGTNALGFILAAQVNVRLLRRYESDAVIRTVLLIQIAAGVLLVAGTAAGLIGLYGTAVLLFVFVSSIGCVFPNTTAMAMAPHGDKAGSASALVGVLQFSLAAVVASIMGALNNGAAMPMAAVIGGCGVGAFVLYRFLVHAGAPNHADVRLS